MLLPTTMLAARRARAAVIAVVASACSTANAPGVDDPGVVDGAPVDVGVDAADPTRDGSPAIDGAAPDATPAADAAGPVDATPVDAAPCAIVTGHTPSLDGTGDLAAYPASQRITPGATLAATDEVALTWDPSWLYVTVSSAAFVDGSKPFHVYVETAAALGAPTAAAGKEYGGLTPRLPFSPTHVIAVRRTDDFGTGAYDGVYTPAPPAWTVRARPLVPGTDVYVSSDNRTISARVPWSALGGCPLAMRVAAHVVNGAVANEWKDVVPATHTPWLASGGAYYEVDLTADPAISGWALR